MVLGSRSVGRLGRRVARGGKNKGNNWDNDEEREVTGDGYKDMHWFVLSIDDVSETCSNAVVAETVGCWKLYISLGEVEVALGWGEEGVLVLE